MELDYERLDPEIRPVLAALPQELAEIDRSNLAALRAIMDVRPAEGPATPVEIRKQSVPSRSGDVPVVIYSHPPEDSAAKRATRAGLLWIHGGGYLFGSAEDDRARGIAEQLECVVVSVDYRLAPEHPFPAGSDDCFAVLEWMASQASTLGIDPGRIAIGGASAGGGLAAGLALRVRDQGGPALAFQLLLYPMIDNLHATPSGQITNHPVWNRRTSFNAWEMYLDGEPRESASPYAAATRARDLSNLPPAYVCVGAEDLFRDEDIDYARRLIEAGVACELAVYPGLFHGADSFMPGAAVSQRLERGFIHALAQALGSPVRRREAD